MHGSRAWLGLEGFVRVCNFFGLIFGALWGWLHRHAGTATRSPGNFLHSNLQGPACKGRSAPSRNGNVFRRRLRQHVSLFVSMIPLSCLIALLENSRGVLPGTISTPSHKIWRSTVLIGTSSRLELTKVWLFPNRNFTEPLSHPNHAPDLITKLAQEPIQK